MRTDSALATASAVTTDASTNDAAITTDAATNDVAITTDAAGPRAYSPAPVASEPA